MEQGGGVGVRGGHGRSQHGEKGYMAYNRKMIKGGMWGQKRKRKMDICTQGLMLICKRHKGIVEGYVAPINAYLVPLQGSRSDTQGYTNPTHHNIHTQYSILTFESLHTRQWMCMCLSVCKYLKRGLGGGRKGVRQGQDRIMLGEKEGLGGYLTLKDNG